MARDTDLEERDDEPAIVTPTLAEIYLTQGHTAQALALYRKLAERAPDDAVLQRRTRTLELRLYREQAEERSVARIERLKRLLRRVQRRRRTRRGEAGR